jgi:lysophospholipase L1-like esterase
MTTNQIAQGGVQMAVKTIDFAGAAPVNSDKPGANSARHSWFRPAYILLVIAALSPCFAPITRGADSPPAATQPAPFEKEIVAFEKSDAVHFPPRDAVLFIGSSSIQKWKTLAEDFPGVTVINRGFGGSRIADSTRYAGRIVLPYHPRKIFFYAGDNDLAAGHTPAQLLADFKEFVKAVRTGQPELPIYFISVKPSPSRAKLMDKMVESNKLIEAYTKEEKGLNFVDVYTPMLGTDGQPRPELFLPDKLHMVHAGYDIWIAKISPLLK